MVAAGCKVNPPMESNCLRVFWHMVPVNNRYLPCEKSGYQYVGRVITGLSDLITDFTFLQNTLIHQENIEQKRIRGKSKN